MKFITNVHHSIKKRGIRGALNHTLKKRLGKIIVKNFKLVEDTEATRLRLSQHFFDLFGGEVRYGELKGFKISRSSWWSTSDKGAKLFGLYEKEVLSEIHELSKSRDIFIDIGAADGFFGVSMVSQNLYSKSYCFEISEQGQHVISETARLNNSTKKISINGIANKDNLKNIPNEELSRSVVLIDIEGDEFDFMSDEIINILSSSVIIIEIHEWFFDDGLERLNALKNRLINVFHIETITTSSRDLSAFPELKLLHDNERWLLCSEGRGRLMEWLVLRPLTHNK